MPARKPGVTAPAPFRQQLLDALPRVRRYARTLCFDPAAVDDLVQATALRALSHWHQYDPHRDMRVWLLSIAHNAHLDRLRQERRLSLLEPDELAAAAQAAHEAQGGHAPGTAERVVLRLDLLAALARVTPAHREILLLVAVEELSYAECAEVLGVPAGTVMSRLARARAALRTALGDDAGRAAPRVPRDAAPGRTLRRVV